MQQEQNPFSNMGQNTDPNNPFSNLKPKKSVNDYSSQNPFSGNPFESIDVKDPFDSEDESFWDGLRNSRVWSAYNQVRTQLSKGLTATPLKGIAVGAGWVDRNIWEPAANALGFDDYEAKEVTDMATWGYGEWMEEQINYLFPTNEEYQGEVLDQIAYTVGDLGATVTSAALTGGVAAAGKEGAKQAVKKTIKQKIKEAATKEGAKSAVKKAVKNSTIGTPLFASTAIGGLQMAIPSYEEAKNAGLDDDEAFEVFLKEYTVGSALERIPVANFFKRFNTATGGGMKEAIIAGITGGSEEAITEVMQQTFSNYIAKEYYDKDRVWDEGLFESGGMGFGLGFALNMMGVGIKNRLSNQPAEIKKELAKQLKKESNDGDVNAYTEAFSDLSIEEIEVMGLDELDRRIKEAEERFRLSTVDKEVESLISEADKELNGEVLTEDSTLEEDLDIASEAEKTRKRLDKESKKAKKEIDKVNEREAKKANKSPKKEKGRSLYGLKTKVENYKKERDKNKNDDKKTRSESPASESKEVANKDAQSNTGESEVNKTTGSTTEGILDGDRGIKNEIKIEEKTSLKDEGDNVQIKSDNNERLQRPESELERSDKRVKREHKPESKGENQVNKDSELSRKRAWNKKVRDSGEFPPHVSNYVIKNKLDPKNYAWDESSSSLISFDGDVIGIKPPKKSESTTSKPIDSEEIEIKKGVEKEKKENAKLKSDLDSLRKEYAQLSGKSDKAIDSVLKRNVDLELLDKKSNESYRRKINELNKLISDEKQSKEKKRIKDLGPVGVVESSIEEQIEISLSKKDKSDLSKALDVSKSESSDKVKIEELEKISKESTSDVKALVERLSSKILNRYKKTDEYKNSVRRDYKEDNKKSKELKSSEDEVKALSKRIESKKKNLRTEVLDKIRKENPNEVNISERRIQLELSKNKSIIKDKEKLKKAVDEYNNKRVESGLKPLSESDRKVLEVQRMTPEQLRDELGDLGDPLDLAFSKEGDSTKWSLNTSNSKEVSISEAVEKHGLPESYGRILEVFNEMMIKKTGNPLRIKKSNGPIGKFSNNKDIKGLFLMFDNKSGRTTSAEIYFTDSKSLAHETIHALHVMYKTLDLNDGNVRNIDRDINNIRTRFKDSLRTLAYNENLSVNQQMALIAIMEKYNLNSVNEIGNAYPFSTNHEFLAHIMTDENVRYLASTIKDSGYKKGKTSSFFRNIFNSLIELVDTMFGGKVNKSFNNSVLNLMSEYESRLIGSFNTPERIVSKALLNNSPIPTLTAATDGSASKKPDIDNTEHVRVLINLVDKYDGYLSKKLYNDAVNVLRSKGHDISDKDALIAWDHNIAAKSGKRNESILKNIRKITNKELDPSLMKNTLIEYMESSIPNTINKSTLNKLMKPIKEAEDIYTLKASIVRLEKVLLDSEFASEIKKFNKFKSRSIRKIDAPIRTTYKNFKKIKPELLSKEELTYLNELMGDFPKNHKKVSRIIDLHNDILSDLRRESIGSDPIIDEEAEKISNEIKKLKNLKKRKESELDIKKKTSSVLNRIKNDKEFAESIHPEEATVFYHIKNGDLKLLSDSYISMMHKGVKAFVEGGYVSNGLLNSSIELRAKVKADNFIKNNKGAKFGKLHGTLVSLLTKAKNSAQIATTLGRFDKKLIKDINNLIYNDIQSSDAKTQLEKNRIMKDVLKTSKGMSGNDFIRIQLYSNIIDTTIAPDETNPDYINEIEENIKFFRNAIENKIKSITNDKKKTQSLESAKNELKIFDDIVSEMKEGKDVLTPKQQELKDHVDSHIRNIYPRAKFNTESVWNQQFNSSFNYSPTIAQGRVLTEDNGKTEFHDDFDEALDNLASFKDDGTPKAFQSGNTKGRSRQNNIYYENNYMTVFDRWLGRTLFDINATQDVKVLGKILKDPNVVKTIGVSNIEELKKVLTVNIRNARGNYRNYHKVVKVLEGLKNTAMVAEMGEIKQVANQLLAVTPSIAIQSPKGFFKASRMMVKNYKKVNEFIENHGQGIQVRNVLQEKFEGSRDYGKKKIYRSYDAIEDQTTNITTYALRKSDEFAAKLTFLSAYLEAGGDLDNPNKELISEAERKTTLLQNISNYNFAPSMLLEKGDMNRVMMSMLFTFKSFALNQSINTIEAIKSAPKSREARTLLLANIANATAFYYVSSYMRELYRRFTKEIGLFGLDYEYEEEEKEENQETQSISNRERAMTRIAYDLLLGGAPEIANNLFEIGSEGFYKSRFDKIKDDYGRNYNGILDNPFYVPSKPMDVLPGGYRVGVDAVDALFDYESYMALFGMELDEDIPNELHPARFGIMESVFMTGAVPFPLRGDVVEIIRAAERAAAAQVREEFK